MLLQGAPIGGQPQRKATQRACVLVCRSTSTGFCKSSTKIDSAVTAAVGYSA